MDDKIPNPRLLVPSGEASPPGARYGNDRVSHGTPELPQQLLGRTADPLRRELALHLARGTPLKCLGAIVTTTSLGGNVAEPRVLVMDRKSMLHELDASLRELVAMHPAVVDPDTHRAGCHEFTSLPFLRALRRTPPRGAVSVLVISGVTAETLPFWP